MTSMVEKDIRRVRPCRELCLDVAILERVRTSLLASELFQYIYFTF